MNGYSELMKSFILILQESGYREMKVENGMLPSEVELEGDEFLILKKNKGGQKVEYEFVFDRGVAHFSSAGLFNGVE